MMDKVLKSKGELPEHELLEVLLYSVISRRNTNDIAHSLIKTFGSLRGVFTAEPEKLKAVKGVGDKVVSYILVLAKVFETVAQTSVNKSYIKSFAEIKDVVLRAFDGEKEEKFLVIFLSKQYQVLSTAGFSDRKDMRVEIDVQELVRLIGVFSPRFIILAHNHPSGRIEPSEQDDITTRKINMICDMHATSLVDHVIVGDGKVYSYYQERRLDEIKKTADINKLLNREI
ncbi:MAG: hypothetical protein J6U92_00070 [Clostridia bacterium]|nr:hypothetical protein [Clostridia bacterium]